MTTEGNKGYCVMCRKETMPRMICDCPEREDGNWNPKNRKIYNKGFVEGQGAILTRLIKIARNENSPVHAMRLVMVLKSFAEVNGIDIHDLG